MYVRRHIRWNIILRFAWRNLLFFIAWSSLVTILYLWLQGRGVNIGIPFLPLSTIGIAVAFYLGFKNSQSYDRFWEGRKIWGGVVNYSRTWANQVLSYLHESQQDTDGPRDLDKVAKELIYRQLAWINALRIQLRKTTIHDRANLSYVPTFKLDGGPNCIQNIFPYLEEKEYEEAIGKANTATHLVRTQGRRLAELNNRGILNNFRHNDMMKTLEEFYNLQGKCERIKNTPFPRQYAYFSTIFVWIFVLLLPFGLIEEFSELQGGGLEWLTVPFTILISWIFTTIEIVGDNSEDPFENYVNDVPMSAICRTIEIDLLQLLGEDKVPEPIKPMGDVLL
ncbi:MAG: bestrophin family ion channel [Cyclobacteriaceae bacterium]